MKISIIIPAYNEEKRIKKTLEMYAKFFEEKKINGLEVEFIIVLNGCIDATGDIVRSCMQTYENISLIDLGEIAGKGIAIIRGFQDALTRDTDFIGFVDADMATSPSAYFELIQNVSEHDGIIASRYMPSSMVYPPRPKWKRWGSKLVYESIIRLLFGLSYYDFQCGAKLFKRHVIKKINKELSVKQWGIDLEILFLCKKYHFKIKELPTVWHDQAHSKMTLRGGLGIIGTVFYMRFKHSFLSRLFGN